MSPHSKAWYGRQEIPNETSKISGQDELVALQQNYLGIAWQKELEPV